MAITSKGVDGLINVLDIHITVDKPERVEATMPITPQVLQPFGFVHGGATLALLETVGSRAAENYCDFETSLPFGIHMDVHHIKGGVKGTVRGVAVLDHVEGSKQYWQVDAYDDEGDVMSTGTFVTKVVTRARLAEKERERSSKRSS